MQALQIVLSQEPPDAETKRNTAVKMSGFESLTEPKFEASVKLVSRRWVFSFTYRNYRIYLTYNVVTIQQRRAI